MYLWSALLVSCVLQCLLEGWYGRARGTPAARLPLIALFLKPWGDIACALYFARSSAPLVLAVLAICIANRLRALHELTHMAAHNALPLEPTTREFVSNVLYQLPAARENFRRRVASHVFGHHAQVGGVKDPNLWTFGIFAVKRGLLSNVLRFYVVGWYRAVSANWANLTGSWRSAAFNLAFYLVLTRTFGSVGLGLYLTALFAAFPLLSLSSLLFEHLWALEIPESAKGKGRAMYVTRDVSKGSWISERLLGIVFLYTDRLHHLHHMYPSLDHVGLREKYESHMSAASRSKAIEYAPIGIWQKFLLLEGRSMGQPGTCVSPQNGGA